MIIVKMWGGLCNQMFQYAFGYSLAKKNNDDVFFDVSFYEDQPSYVKNRTVSINHFFNLSKFQTIGRPSQVTFFENNYINHIIRHFNNFHINLSNNLVFIKEPFRKYCKDVVYIKDRTNYYDGYWQTDNYFKCFREEILEEYSLNYINHPNIEEFKKQVSDKNSVALHIRLGDLINKKKTCAGYNEETILDYYTKAVGYCTDVLKDPCFFLFTDDIAWCKNKLHFKNLVIVNETIKNSSIEDLFCISFCHHGIMSPSTFSWWGNWLRKDSIDSLVVAPKNNDNNEFFNCPNWVTL